MTTVIQLREIAAAASPMSATWPRRRRQSPAEATRVISHRAGRTIHASIILAWKATPTQNPVRSADDHRPLTTTETAASAASRTARTINESEMLPRLRATVAGARVRTAAARRPAAAPASRRTTRNSTITDTVPSITWGRTMDQVCSPNTRTERAWTQNAPGSLSRVTVPAGSNAAKKKLCQSIDMLRTAAA